MMDMYGVIIQRSIYHEGDERSRTNPGHGYPAYYMTYNELMNFSDIEKLKNWIFSHEREIFTVIKYQTLSFTKTISIELDA